ncbi:MAG: ornithine carbamoyltransferase [Acidobacteria bacterium]|nr:ornithine carbamoyltransferase [Acidobacteriota bacterium]
MTRAWQRLKGRSLLRDTDLDPEEYLSLLELAEELRGEKREGIERQRLSGRSIALIFEKSSTRTRSAFEVAAYDQGAHVTYMGPGETQLGHKETIRDTARVLSRMYDGIEFRGFAHADVEELSQGASVPVWNGLTDQWHPTQLLADIMTISDHARKPLAEVALCYIGDARNNTANSLLVVASMLGLDVRVVAPEGLLPSKDVRATARDLANVSGARVLVTSEIDAAVAHADYLYTDVWVSMGEPMEKWGERIKELLSYQVNSELLAKTGNPDVRVLHCLPALHNADTELGAQLAKSYGVSALEITDDVFESDASLVFDQAENRLHTIKALMVASLTSE